MQPFSLFPVGDNEKVTFRVFKGFQILSKLLSLASTQRSLSSLSATSLLGIRAESTNNQISPLPDRTLSNICKTIVIALNLKDEMANVNYVINISNKCLTPVIERMNQILRFEEISVRLGSTNLPNSANLTNSTFSVSDDILSDLMGVICTVLDKIRTSNTENINGSDNIDAALDFISLIISVGTIDLIGEKLKRIRTSIDDAPDTCLFLINTASTISVICHLLKKFENQSSCHIVKQHFTQACEQNDFAAIIPVVYTVLVLSGSQLEPRPTIFDGSQFGDEEREMSLLKKDSMNRLPLRLAKVTYVCLQSINACFGLGMSLEHFAEPQMTIHLFRHIFNYLLWHLIRTDENNNILKYKNYEINEKSNLQKQQYLQTVGFNELETDILLELMQLIGHFCIGSKERQDFLATGVQPTVLAQLCALPFSFFNEPKKRNVLLPTLFVICYENESNISYLEGLDMSRALLQEVIDNDEMNKSPIFGKEGIVKKLNVEV